MHACFSPSAALTLNIVHHAVLPPNQSSHYGFTLPCVGMATAATAGAAPCSATIVHVHRGYASMQHATSRPLHNRPPVYHTQMPTDASCACAIVQLTACIMSCNCVALLSVFLSLYVQSLSTWHIMEPQLCMTQQHSGLNIPCSALMDTCPTRMDTCPTRTRRG